MIRRPRGMTLFELLLVLAILVGIAALAAPTLFRSMEEQRLMKGGELVRAEWGRARNLAMKSGRLQMFRYEPGGRRFVVQPWSEPDDYLDTDAKTAAQDQARTAGLPLGAEGSLKQLPDGLLFVADEVRTDARSVPIEQTLLQGGLSEASWSRPILFYADGVCSTARVVVRNQYGHAATISLRGLTGTMRVRRDTDAP